MNIIEWVIKNKYAKNVFQATHIVNGLQLASLHGNPDKQIARVRLYRRWRDSKVYNDTKSCFAKAILGEEPPAEMFESV